MKKLRTEFSAEDARKLSKNYWNKPSTEIDFDKIFNKIKDAILDAKFSTIVYAMKIACLDDTKCTFIKNVEYRLQNLGYKVTIFQENERINIEVCWN